MLLHYVSSAYYSHFMAVKWRESNNYPGAPTAPRAPGACLYSYNVWFGLVFPSMSYFLPVSQPGLEFLQTSLFIRNVLKQYLHLNIIVFALVRDKRVANCWCNQLLSTFPPSQCEHKRKGEESGHFLVDRNHNFVCFWTLDFCWRPRHCRLCSNYLVFYQGTQNTSLTLSILAIVFKKMKIHLCK